MVERREYPRLDERWEMTYRKLSAEEIEPISTFTVNISGGGICFTAEEELEPNTLLALELKSPQFPSPIIALAKVVWCRKRGLKGGYEVGAEFWWIGWKDNTAQQAIAEHVRRALDSKGGRRPG